LPTSSVEPVLDQPGGDLGPFTLPTRGEVLVPIVIEIAGSSTVISGGDRVLGSARVSPIVISGMPATR
jgi:hypothetical protein